MKTATETEIGISVDGVTIKGNLNIPGKASSLVIFSHGSGSSRFSPRNRFVSEQLNDIGFATLLIDLLTTQEDEIYETRFDIEKLSDRLVGVTNYFLKKASGFDFNNFGFFGASTGAASALIASVELKPHISAVVSRGGRPDLAYGVLAEVECPVLLIVGGADYQVIELNEQAYAKLNCVKEIKIVPGATHLFGEPGKLEEVSELAGEWFRKYL